MTGPRDTTRNELAALIHAPISEAFDVACIDWWPDTESWAEDAADAILARWRLVPVEKPRSGTPSWSPRIAYPHDTPIPCYEDDLNRCACETCINEPKVPGKRPLSL